MPGVSSTGERSGAVVIPGQGDAGREFGAEPQCERVGRFVVADGSTVSASCGARACWSGIKSASVVHSRLASERLSRASR